MGHHMLSLVFTCTVGEHPLPGDWLASFENGLRMKFVAFAAYHFSCCYDFFIVLLSFVKQEFRFTRT